MTALIYRNPLGPLGDLTYQYDTAGDRTGIGGSFARTLLPDPATVATYNAGNRQLAFGNKTLTYDANGNLLSITDPAGVTAFTWDARNRLTGISGPTVTATFQYDVFGRRTGKLVNDVSSLILYDGQNPLLELLPGRDVSYLSTLAIDELLTLTEGLAVLGYLTDPLGSTVALVDSDGSVTTSYSYEPFGRAAGTGIASSNPFQFTGRETDGTGFHYHRARYYSPTLGRFLSEDPLGFRAGDANLYGYAMNNPLTWTDLLGLEVLNPDQYPIPSQVLQALERFNDYIGRDKDVVITSGNRAPSPNLSPDTHGDKLAADIKVPGQPHLLTANQAADSGLFGGVGWYEEGYYNPKDPKIGPHVHVDLRKGTARWGYNKHGREYHGTFPKYPGVPQQSGGSKSGR